jgi:hypothetical protein
MLPAVHWLVLGPNTYLMKLWSDILSWSLIFQSVTLPINWELVIVTVGTSINGVSYVSSALPQTELYVAAF